VFVERLNKFFITASLIALAVLFSTLTIPPRVIDAQTNASLGDKAVKLIIFSRTKQLEAPAASMPAGDVQCLEGEVVTGGGFKLNDPAISTIVASNKVSNGWAVSFVNDGGYPTSATIFAQCAHIEISP
jgi:hypothetical protein